MSATGKWLQASDFEARYRADPDPWGYETSAYERRKYDATLAACGPGPFDAVFELGASIGVFSALLAPRCRLLTTVDYSPTAVALARKRLESHSGANASVGAIPRDLPEGRYDLIVASEILYYLAAPELDATVAWTESALIAGGRLVCVHWRPSGPERPLTAEAAHLAVARSPSLTRILSRSTDEYLLEVFQRDE